MSRDSHIVGSNDQEKKKELEKSLPSSLPFPWLMISHGKDADKHTFFSISENRYYTRSACDMRNKYVWSSPYGWWVMNDVYGDDRFLFNPESMEKIQLPPLEPIRPGIPCDICILSVPPSDPQCHVLFVDIYDDSVYFCQPGDEKFVKQKLESQLQAATTVGGNIFGMLAGWVLVSITFSQQALQLRELTGEMLPKPSFLETICLNDFLIESCGELLLVHQIFSASYTREVISFKIFKWTSESGWLEFKNIGERVIFLSSRYGMCCTAEDQGIRGNCIYFTGKKDINLYVYDVEDEGITMFLPCPTASQRKSVSKWVSMLPGRYLE